MSTEVAGGEPLLVPLLSVTTRPSKHRSGSNGWVEEGDDVHGESRTFWTESLIATLCCFPIGIVSLCYSLEVIRWNNEGKYGRAHVASRKAESAVKFAFRFSAVLYVALGVVLLGLIEAGIVLGIDWAHTSQL